MAAGWFSKELISVLGISNAAWQQRNRQVRA
jgi:hypothetical protein